MRGQFAILVLFAISACGSGPDTEPCYNLQIHGAIDSASHLRAETCFQEIGCPKIATVMDCYVGCDRKREAGGYIAPGSHEFCVSDCDRLPKDCQ